MLSLHRDLPRNITSYDVVKTLAIVLMIVDHVGFYFFPEENWFRVFGRMCVPMWFFLIGYANSRDLSWPLWVGAALLIASDAITGHDLFPLNILPTMIITRFMLDYVMGISLRSKALYIVSVVVLTVLSIVTMLFYEYGLESLVLAGFGYVIRHKDNIRIKNPENTVFASVLVSFFLVSQLTFGFTVNQMVVLGAGLALVCGWLMSFKPEEYPDLTRKMPAAGVALVQFTGRHTLLIYVVHLLVFKFAALLLGYEGFGWFDFTVFEDGRHQLSELYDLFSGKGIGEGVEDHAAALEE